MDFPVNLDLVWGLSNSLKGGEEKKKKKTWSTI